jgi:primosomal protein N'
MKPQPEYVEGPEAWARFQSAMKKVLAVLHSEIQRRIKEHRKEAARNPNRSRAEA